MVNRKRPSIGQMIADTKLLLASDSVNAEERADLERRLREISEQSEYDIAAYDFFLEHMPEDDADMTLIILKGHLLVEHAVRSFVEARLFAPDALVAARLTSHQLICLAEAMCLPNPDPAWLWSTVRKLNSLRNSLAHDLLPEGIQDRVNSFMEAYHNRYEITSGLTGCLGNLYAQVTELARLAQEPGFRIPPKAETKK